LGNHHIKGIERLYQLRYLDISGTGITELPREIGDLMYLEMLVARFCGLGELPESTTRLRRLTHLFVGSGCKLPDGWGNLVNLQELEEIDALQLKHAEQLGKLTNLRTLAINLRSGGIEGDKLIQSKEKLVSSLCKLEECGLRSLSITYHLNEKDGEELFLPALGCIREVDISGKNVFQISRWLASLPNLRRLFFEGSKIEQQDIEMIGLIPNLLELTLFAVNLYDARQLIISCKGFQQFQIFRVYYSHMGALMFEPGAMPRLKELTLIISSNKMPNCAAVDFDLGIQHLSSLAFLDVNIFCDGWRAAEVKATEDAFKSMAEANPNRPTLKMTRYRQSAILQDEQIDMGGSGTNY
jgi:Leucine-rich repeat (LRR) protein